MVGLGRDHHRVLAAAVNTAGWCDMARRSHGIPTVIRPEAWVALRRAPDL